MTFDTVDAKPVSVHRRVLRRGLHIPRRLLGFSSLMLLMLPILTAVRIQLVGELMLSDVVVAIVTLLLLLRGRLSLSWPYLKLCLSLCCLWLLAAIVSDMVNGTSSANYLRGWANIAFFALYLLVMFHILAGRPDRVRIAVVGIAIGLMSNATRIFLGGITSDLITVWKMGFGLGTMIFLAVILARRPGSEKRAGKFMLMLSPINMFLASRSLFLFTCLAGLLSGFSVRLRSKRQRVAISCALVATFALAVPIGEAAYDRLVLAGTFGEEVLQKHLMLGASDMGVLLSGRSETLASLTAIGRSPFLGNGSWAEDWNLVQLYNMRREQAGQEINWQRIETVGTALIPTHSALLGAWVWHGVLGAVFWLAAFSMILRALVASIYGHYRAGPAIVLVLIMALWDILFSPFAADRRYIFATILGICGIILSTKPTSRPSHNSVSIGKYTPP